MARDLMLLSLLLRAGSSLVLADDFKRFEFQPYGGLTASGSIPLETEDNGTKGSIHVDSSHNAGATFTVNMNALDAIEGRWQRQFTEGHLPAEVVEPRGLGPGTLFHLEIDQIHCDFVHHYRLTGSKALPFVMAGLGATRYYADAGSRRHSRTYFSFALGGGIKYFFSSHFGLRGEARWSPTLLSASGSDFWCSIGGAGADCVIKLETALQQQLDLTGGIVIPF
jgi:hypothetical protein